MFETRCYDHPMPYQARVGLTEDQKTEVGSALVFGVIAAAVGFAMWSFTWEKPTPEMMPETIR